MTITAEQAAKLLEGATPGPWELDGVRPHTAHVWPVNGSDEPITGEIDIANARLIAAAPNFAGAAPRASEMLRVVAAFLRDKQPDGTAFYDAAECDALCIADDCEAAADDIDAAIAKARGEA